MASSDGTAAFGSSCVDIPAIANQDLNYIVASQEQHPSLRQAIACTIQSNLNDGQISGLNCGSCLEVRYRCTIGERISHIHDRYAVVRIDLHASFAEPAEVEDLHRQTKSTKTQLDSLR